MERIIYIILLVLYGVIMIIMCCIVLFKKKEISKNKVHFYVARNKNGELWLYIGKPKRGYDTFFFCSSDAVMYLGHGDTLKMYGLNEHDYDSLKWEDKPVEVFLNMKD